MSKNCFDCIHREVCQDYYEVMNKNYNANLKFAEQVPCNRYLCKSDIKDDEPGEWVKFDKVLYCSKCEECNPYKTKFCPHCGAPMVEHQLQRQQEKKDGT